MVNRYLDKITCGDCLEIMPQLPDASINLIILDLPYNIKKAEWDKIDDYITFAGAIFKECERVLKGNGSLYWFHNDFNTIVDVYTRLRDNSRFVFKQFIVWNKKYDGVSNEGYLQGFNEPGMLINYQRFAEYILYFTLDGKPIKEYMQREKTKAGFKTNRDINRFLGFNDSGGQMASRYFATNHSQGLYPTKEVYKKLQTTGYFQREYNEVFPTFNNQKTHHSVWNYPIAQKVGHVTPKPVELIETIVEYSSNEGDIVLDPTSGGGTTAVACHLTDRHYICIEKEEEYCAIAEKRIKEML